MSCAGPKRSQLADYETAAARSEVAGGWSDSSTAVSVWPPEVSPAGGRRTVSVRKCAVIADRLWPREGGRLLVAILGRGHERLERRQLLQRSGCGAFIGVQLYDWRESGSWKTA